MTRPRISPTGMEPQYQCRYCGDQAWRSGGVSRFGRHLQQVHGIEAAFPVVSIVDTAGNLLDFSGSYVYEGRGQARRKARPPTTGIDGLIRTAKAIVNIGTGGLT